jgi:N6-adenosine-specific RNA methylase IME4
MRDVMDVRIDEEFRRLIPPLSSDERAALEQSLIEHGCRDPIITWDGAIVDGHNRHAICTAHGIEYKTLPMIFGDRIDAKIWIRRNQVSRRNLTDDQRAMNAAELAELQAEKSRRDKAKAAVAAREVKAGRRGFEDRILVTDAITEISDARKQAAPRVRTEVAKAAGISERKVSQAQAVKKAAPDLAAKVAAGDMPLAAAVREVKRAEIVQKLESVEAKEVKALAGEYDVIVIDPPWPMQKIERDERPNQSQFDYPVMQEHELAALKMPSSDDCHLWLWTTHKFMPMAFRLLDAWGFKYVCTFVWHKPGGFQPIGLPQYNCEFALYARRGSPQFIDTKAFPVCFNAPRGAHSEKPEEFYEVVRRVTAGRRIDIFNRRAIEGFDVWGNEANA